MPCLVWSTGFFDRLFDGLYLPGNSSPLSGLASFPRPLFLRQPIPHAPSAESGRRPVNKDPQTKDP